MTQDKLIAISIFGITYMLIIFKKGKPLLVLLIAAVLFVLTGVLSIKQLIASININVLGVFLGTMVLSHLFIFSKAPVYLAEKLVDSAKTSGRAMLFVCILAGIISSFVDNVATVLIVAPIALTVAKKQKVNPVPFLIGVAVSANLQGCATMIGDAPSILMAIFANMNFNDFFWMKGKPGIAFAVELGAVAAFYVLHRVFKKYDQPVIKIEPEKVITWVPLILIILMILTLILSSLFLQGFSFGLAIVCLSFGCLGLIWYEASYKKGISLIKDLDMHTFLFLIGIFILVGGLTQSRVIDDAAMLIKKFSYNSPVLAYTNIVVISVLISAFVDNIPYTMAMLPVAKIMAISFNMPEYPFLFGLLLGTCLGGNITPIGASANVAVVGMLRKHGYHVSFADFAKIGIPFTIAATSIGAAFIWIIWGR